MSSPLGRRQWLGAALSLPAAAAVACRKAGRRAAWDVKEVGPDAAFGHRLRGGNLPRDGDFAGVAVARRAVVIVGAGPAGLAAGYTLRKHGVDNFSVLDLEPYAGGTSAYRRNERTAYPLGAHYLPLPMAHNTQLCAFLDEMGALDGVDSEGHPRGQEHFLIRQPAERVHYRGFWYEGLFPYSGATERDRRQLLAFESIVDDFAAMRDGKGRRAFAIPVDMSSQDPELAKLDDITAQAFLDARGLDSPLLRWWLEYGLKDDYGLTLEIASAWSLLFYFASRKRTKGSAGQQLLAWPEGNGRTRRSSQKVGGAANHDRTAVHGHHPASAIRQRRRRRRRGSQHRCGRQPPPAARKPGHRRRTPLRGKAPCTRTAR